MRIAMLAAGSRGDYEPVLALAAGLRARGHEVGVTASSDYVDDVRAAGFAVEEVEVEALRIYREKVAPAMPTTLPGQLERLGRWAAELAPEVGRTVRGLWPRYDAVVSTALTISWAGVLSAVDPRPHVTVLFVPAFPSTWGDASMLSVREGRSPANLVAGRHALGPGRQLSTVALQHLGPSLSRAQRARAVRNLVTTPTFVAHSPRLIAERRVMGRRIHCTGYPFASLEAGTSLSARTESFLAAGPAPVYAGFGSQSSATTREALRHSVSAARLLGHRVVVLRGTGLEEDGWDADVLFVDGEPHELLLPRTRTVVHHGGAGTTAAALRSGIPQVVVPFVLDQPFFGRRVQEIGVAGEPVPVASATTERVAASLRQAEDEAVRRRAADVGRLVRAEDGVVGGVAFVERALGRHR
jgi:sterol 3beta-glucosyltransferase